MKTNRIAVIEARRRVAWMDEEPVPDPKAGEVLVRTDYSLISAGTELAMFNQTHIGFSDPSQGYAKYPFRPGYAAAGTVDACGRDVTAFKEGDRVYFHGKHQAHALLDLEKQAVFHLSDGLDSRHAPYARLAQIAATAPSVCDARAGADVCVVGLGLVGNLAAQIYRLRGARVLGVDPVARRCQVAEACGIEAFQGLADDAFSALETAFAKPLADVVVEATGHPAAAAPAIALARRRGEVAFLGSTRGKVELDVYSLIHKPGRILRGAHMMTLPPTKDGSGLPDQASLIREMLHWIERRALLVEPLLTETMPADALQQAYERLDAQPETYASIVLDWK